MEEETEKEGFMKTDRDKTKSTEELLFPQVTVTQDGHVIDESTYKIPAGDKTNASTEIQISESSERGSE